MLNPNGDKVPDKIDWDAVPTSPNWENITRNTYKGSTTLMRTRMLYDSLFEVIPNLSLRRNCAIAESVYSWGELLESSRYLLTQYIEHMVKSPEYLAWKNKDRELSGV